MFSAPPLQGPEFAMTYHHAMPYLEKDKAANPSFSDDPPGTKPGMSATAKSELYKRLIEVKEYSSAAAEESSTQYAFNAVLKLAEQPSIDLESLRKCYADAATQWSARANSNTKAAQPEKTQS